MDNTQKELIEIRCPFNKKSKIDQKLHACNRICVKVTPGSAGEARCRSCHLSFEFEVDNQAHSATGIRVRVTDPTEE